MNDGKIILFVDIVFYFKNDKLKYFVGKYLIFFKKFCL